ncbi:MAG: hypothetical protein WCT08_01560 [Patescibacteria group bacterium]|jgi:primosomal protein N'
MQNNLFSVVPLRRLPKKLSLLDYQFSKKGQNPDIGEVVEIPFGKQAIRGVVWNILKKETIDLKKIKYLSKQKNFEKLSRFQILLSNWLAENTLTPISQVLLGITPDIKASEYSLNPSKIQAKLFIAQNLHEREKLIKIWLKKVKKENYPSLVVIPAYQYAETWLKNFPENSIFIHSKLSKKEKLNALQKIHKVKLIIVTHSGLLYPLPRLARVIIDQADDDGYFAFDQAPRLDVRKLAQAVAYIQGVNLTLLARWQSPTILSFNPVLKFRKISENLKPIIIDRNLESFEEKKVYINQSVLDRVANGKNFWLVFRKEEARLLICDDCKLPVFCPKCKNPLTPSTGCNGDKLLKCKIDNLTVLPPEICPNCHGSNLKLKGLGIQKISQILKNIIKDGNILIFEKNSKAIALDNIKNIVGTSAITRYLNVKFDNLIILNPETARNNSEYRNEESIINSIISVAQHLKPKNSFFIQTYEKENSIANSLVNLDETANRISKERKNFNYPPFGTLISLKTNSRNNIAKIPLSSYVRKQISQKFNLIENPGNFLIKGPLNDFDWILKILNENLPEDYMVKVNPPSIS